LLPLALIGAGGLLLRALVAGAGAGLATVVTVGLSESLGDARAQQSAGLVLGFFALFLMAIGIAEDLARAAVIRFRVPAARAARLALTAFRQSPFTTCVSWTWRLLAGCVPIVIGALVAERLDGRGGPALLALFLVHQAIVIARVALRASWLAKALRVVDQAHEVRKPRRTLTQSS
jgi:hypothetical protein